MKGILADVNIQGQASILLLVLQAEPWREFWEALGVSILTFADLSLPTNASDAEIWQACQDQQLILLTGNRNKDGPDSLEATIRARNAADSLPVLTIADPEAVRHSRAYAEQVVERLLTYLEDIDNCRGTGRLYIP